MEPSGQTIPFPDTPARITLTEDLLNKVAAAMTVAPLDERLFDLTAGETLAAKLDAIMGAVRTADVDKLVRAQQPRFALLGADVEARMTFALARKSAHAALGEAAVAATRLAAVITLLEDARGSMEGDVRRLDNLAEMTAHLVRQLAPAETREATELRARFDRRLSSLNFLRASSALTLAHIPQAIARNRQLLDRFQDVNAVLFPLWDRHALAVLQSPRDAKVLADALAEAARSLGIRLLAHGAP